MKNESVITKEEAILDTYKNVLPFIQSMLPDVAMGITNREEWLAYYPGEKINLGVKAGVKIMPDEPLAECIKYRKEIRTEVDPEFFGFSFTGLAKPIVENNKVVGAIAIQLQEQNEKKLMEISDTMVSALSQANDGVSSIAKGADDLASATETLQTQSKNASGYVNEIVSTFCGRNIFHPHECKRIHEFMVLLCLESYCF